ncbi:hypothetical protein BSKO_13719 [Bryopsis sp. KO-2023]|nr:hypothetical protein BSKO_13719 [Bryopsis sp. KO-2023]
MALTSSSVKLVLHCGATGSRTGYGFGRPLLVSKQCLRKFVGCISDAGVRLAVLPSSFGERCDGRKSRQPFVVHASGNGRDYGFNSEEYVEAKIEAVRHTDAYGHVIYLKLRDETESRLPVYIGSFECAALVKEINKKPTVRPMTHDLMKNSLVLLGYKVSRVMVTALVGNTYHARIVYRRSIGNEEEEVDVDARPSDAFNLAVRFDAPMFVNKSIADRMAHSMQTLEKESSNEVVQSCRDEVLHHKDPTVMLKLQLQMAIAEERYIEAAKLRDVIDKMLSTDRALGLVVALESALDGNRYEEAAFLRDELRKLRAEKLRGGQSQAS